MLGFYAKHLKDHTAALFLQPVYDSFALAEAQITVSYQLKLEGQCLAEGSPEPFVTWEKLRPVVLAAIKGETLKSFHLVFLLTREKTEAFLKSCGCELPAEQVRGLFLNFRFQGEQLSVTTGVSLTVFSADRSLEQAWDKQIRLFLGRQGLGEEV